MEEVNDKARETDVVLRGLRFDAMTAKNIKQMVIKIRSLCDKDVIAAVEKEVAEYEIIQQEE